MRNIKGKDNKEDGYRLVYRSTIKNNLVGFEKPYSKAEAWIWLLLHAVGSENGYDTNVEINKKQYSLHVDFGCFVAGQRNLATKWGWTKQQVRTFLNKLQNENMIKTEQIKVGLSAIKTGENAVNNGKPALKPALKPAFVTHITICNFLLYQQRKNDEKPALESALKPNKEHDILEDHVIDIYSHWNSQNFIVHKKHPKSGKRTLQSIVKELTESYTVDEIKQTIDNYIAIVRGDNYYFSHKWGLADFLARGFDRFVDWGIADHNFRIKESKGRFDPQKDREEHLDNVFAELRAEGKL